MAMGAFVTLSEATERAVGRRWLLGRAAVGLSGLAAVALLPKEARAAGASAPGIGAGTGIGFTDVRVARLSDSHDNPTAPLCNGDYCGSVCTSRVNLCEPRCQTYCDVFCGPGCSYYANCRCTCLCGCCH